MSKVHTFALTGDIYPDTRFPLQWPGNGLDPTPLQVEFSTIVGAVAAQIGFSVGYTVNTETYTFEIPVGRWLVGIAVESADAQTFQCGLSAGTDELISAGSVGAGDVSTFGVLLYGGATGKNIYFSALTGTSTITFLMI